MNETVCVFSIWLLMKLPLGRKLWSFQHSASFLSFIIHMHYLLYCCFVVVQLLSRVWLSVPPWTAACHACLSFTISWSLFTFMSVESMIPSNYPILCYPLLLPSIFPSIRVFSKSRLFASGSQSIGVPASASVFPINLQGWFPSGLIGLISLQSKGLSRVFSKHHSRNHQFFGTQPPVWSNSHISTWLPGKP